MKMTARLQQKIQQRDTKAACLMENAMPWYSVMVHLGRPELQTKGVWLKSIALRSDKKVEIRGEALSFSALSTFLQSFEADRDFFLRVQYSRSLLNMREPNGRTSLSASA